MLPRRDPLATLRLPLPPIPHGHDVLRLALSFVDDWHSILPLEVLLVSVNLFVSRYSSHLYPFRSDVVPGSVFACPYQKKMDQRRTMIAAAFVVLVSAFVVLASAVAFVVSAVVVSTVLVVCPILKTTIQRPAFVMWQTHRLYLLHCSRTIGDPQFWMTWTLIWLLRPFWPSRPQLLRQEVR